MDAFTVAIQDVAHDHGVKRLAGDMGCNYNVLLNQLNPHNDRPISLNKFFQLVRFTHDVRLLQPLLDEMGLVATSAAESPAGASLLNLMTDHQVSFGCVAGTVRDALEDGRIDARERKAIAEAVQEEIDALCRLRSALEGMAEPRLAKA